MILNDERYMLAALDAARTVAGMTGDNPPVGCVIVHGGDVVATGATQPPGGAHAEVMAVNAARDAGVNLQACDLYVILEPCSFTGRTPPCSRLLLQVRPRRVIVGVRDPHPQVRGSGIAELRGAGVDVVEGVLTGPIREFLAGWLRRFPPIPA